MVVRRLLLLAAIAIFWVPNAFAVGIWGEKAGDTYTFNRGTWDLLDSYITPTGFGQIWPGNEGLTPPAYRPGVCYVWLRYDAYRIIGTPLEAWPAGVLRFRADSTGISVTGNAVVSGNVNINNGSDIVFSGSGAAITFDANAANIISATHANGTVRIAAGGGLQKFEANTNGVNISGALDVSTKATVADSLHVTKRTNLEGGVYIGGQFITKVLCDSLSLNFDLTGVSSTHDLTIPVPGAGLGNACIPGIPAAAMVPGVVYSEPWVSSPGVVTIRAVRTCDSAPDPLAGMFKVWVIK